MKRTRANPVLHGIIDTFAGAELLRQSQIPHKNRLAVILIDSGFETACRAYLQYVAKIKMTEAHKHRDNLVQTVKAKLKSIDEQVWKDINYYYTDIRCDFYHQSAGKTITDVALLDYAETVEFVINEAFGVDLSALVRLELTKSALPVKEDERNPQGESRIPVTMLKNSLEKLLIAVDMLMPINSDEVNHFFKKEGETARFKQEEFVDVVGRNSRTRKFFYFDKMEKRWKVSGLGKFKINQMLKESSNGKGT